MAWNNSVARLAQTSSTGSATLGRYGLSSRNGRLVGNRPFAHSVRLSGHKGRFAIVTDAA